MNQIVSLLLITTCAISVTASSYYSNRYGGSLETKCEYDADCTPINSYCKNQRLCTCKRDYEYDMRTDSCLPTRIGHTCEDDGDCSQLINSQCRNGVCQCRSGYVVPQENTGCLPMSRLQASCQDDAQCNATEANSVCNLTTRVCACQKGFHEDKFTSACIRTKRLGENCQTDIDCGATGFACILNPETGIRRCSCQSGFKQDGSTSCIKPLDGGANTYAISFACLVIATLCLTVF